MLLRKMHNPGFSRAAVLHGIFHKEINSRLYCARLSTPDFHCLFARAARNSALLTDPRIFASADCLVSTVCFQQPGRLAHTCPAFFEPGKIRQTFAKSPRAGRRINPGPFGAPGSLPPAEKFERRPWLGIPLENSAVETRSLADFGPGREFDESPKF